MRSLCCATTLLLLLVNVRAGAQIPSGKKVLTQDTYDLWRTIQGSSLSPDGKWAAYTLSPVVGDGEVVLRATQSSHEWRIPRGWTGRPITSVSAADSPFVAPALVFSADSRVLAFLGYAPKADFDKARAAKRPAAPQPKSVLNIVDVATGRATTVPRVRSFRLPRESARHLVYLLEPEEAPRDTSAGRNGAAPAKKKDYGSTLVIHDLGDASEQRIEDVLSYVVDDSAHALAYTVSSRAPTADGVFVRTLATGQTITAFAGEGNHKQLVLDRAGAQLAFVSDRDEYGRDKPRFSAYYATVQTGPAGASTAGGGSAVAIATAGAVGGMSPSDKARVEFTRDGSAVVFGVAPPPIDSIPSDSLADKAVFDLWHWKDPKLQPQQKLEATRDRDRAFSTVWMPSTRRLLRVANDSMPNAVVSDDARVALSVTQVPYMVESMWGAGGADVYATDLATGKVTRVATEVEFGATLSPGGRYIAFFDKDRWNAYSVATGKTVDLTSQLRGVSFHNEEWDSPDTPPSYGVAGWTRDDRSLLVYDHYDVWELDPNGVRAPRMVTDSAGTRARMTLRLVDLDPDDRFVDPVQPLLLRAFNEETKASGFYSDRLDAVRPPQQVVMGDRNYGTPQKARRADQFLLTQQTVSEFPDLWSGTSLSGLAKISAANPQQEEYTWPSVELVRWLNSDGVPLQGLLYKPQGFDAAKKYPMVVYYYERLSDGLHNYNAPTGRNVINPTVYTSLGYLVFFPDIVYEVGWPGPSAEKSIVPGVQSLIQRGFVNPKAIGLAGQSWGGYQTAYLITQTNMFAAAVPNAPVANMTSAYGGIRWGSGLARSFQYEKTQSRIGGSIWEYPVRFIENSPLFHLDRVTTPVFFMQNDADDAVPWYQGIELFVGLRRLGKEVYFITYNGDVHNPRKRANQKDVDMRMQQFFANKLLGAPAPEWMVRGIPYLEKGRDQMGKKVVP